MMSSLLIQKREHLQNEKRHPKKENATPPHSEKPLKPAAIILHFIGTLKRDMEADKLMGIDWIELKFQQLFENFFFQKKKKKKHCNLKTT